MNKSANIFRNWISDNYIYNILALRRFSVESPMEKSHRTGIEWNPAGCGKFGPLKEEACQMIIWISNSIERFFFKYTITAISQNIICFNKSVFSIFFVADLMIIAMENFYLLELEKITELNGQLNFIRPNYTSFLLRGL